MSICMESGNWFPENPEVFCTLKSSDTQDFRASTVFQFHAEVLFNVNQNSYSKVSSKIIKIVIVSMSIKFCIKAMW